MADQSGYGHPSLQGGGGAPATDSVVPVTPDQVGALRNGACWTWQIEPVLCDYTLSPIPTGQGIYPDQLLVLLTDGSGQAELILENPAADCTEGWQLINDTLRLCPATCARSKEDNAVVELFEACSGPPLR